jgi:hypothetical protein
MPWVKGDYPPSYKNQPVKIREKAVELLMSYWLAPESGGLVHQNLHLTEK